MDKYDRAVCESVASEESVSIKYGAKVIDRPKNLASDDSKSEDSLLHFISNISCDVIVFIQPTSPFISSDYIDEGIAMIGEKDSVFSAYKEHWLPRWKDDGVALKPYGWSPEERPMRQDVSPTYVENGAFYITTTHQLSKTGLRYSGSIGVVTMPLYDSIQIDSYDDLCFAKMIANFRIKD